MRRFEPHEAEAILPWLRERLEQLQALQDAAEEKYIEKEKLRAIGTREDGRLIMEYDYRLAQHELHEVLTEAHRLLAEIHATGCQVKDIREGLVDFPARIAGEDVLLCWRLGEPGILYYHGLHDGFAGRRPLNGGAANHAG